MVSVMSCKAGYRGVQLRDSGRFNAELQCDGQRHWLGTFETAEIAARAFDIACWRLARPRHELNFPEIESQAAAEFVSLRVNIVFRKVKRETRIVLE